MYSRVGGGHLSAATALADELQRRGCSVQLADAYLECGRFPATQFPRFYAWLASRHPGLWAAIYHGTGASGLSPDLVVRPLLRAGMQRLVQQTRPSVVVSVLPAINSLLARVSGRVEVVLTDWYAVHRFWVARGVSHYTAPTEAAGTECVQFGAPPDAVDVVGIPVRRQFVEEVAQLPQPAGRFRVLAMVGAEGSPRSLRNLAALANARLEADLIVVCGRNERLRRGLSELPRVHAVGYVENVAGLMRSADLLVTKAGGLTLAEAFCCHAPVVVHDVVPGQEAGNLEYVLGQGAAAYARSPSELVDTVAALIEDPARRARLADCGARLARPDAAAQIASNILTRLERDRD